MVVRDWVTSEVNTPLGFYPPLINRPDLEWSAGHLAGHKCTPEAEEDGEFH